MPTVPEQSEPVSRDERIPGRELRDPRVLRAMAHPVRMQILEELAVLGQATATELAERLGESAANCSWHLRQLAQYGFIEEAGGGTGRQRPWRAVQEVTKVGPGDEDPEVARAGDAVAEVIQERVFQALRDWTVRRRQESAPWRKAGFSNNTMSWLTADELRELEAEMFQLAMRHVERSADPSLRPPGARPVRFFATAFPMHPAATGDLAESGQRPEDSSDDD